MFEGLVLPYTSDFDVHVFDSQQAPSHLTRKAA